MVARHRSKKRGSAKASSASPSRPPPVATPRVQEEWRRRVEAEYRSAAVTQELTLWLIQIGASPDLIHDGLRIVSDELAHAQLSDRVFRASDGAGTPILDRSTLSLARHFDEPLECDVTRTCVRMFCLNETVAVPLFAAMRKHAFVAPACTALDRIIVDEVRHRDFGWTLLAELLRLPMADELRALVERELADAFAGIRAAYAGEGSSIETDDVSTDERAWGLISTPDYAEIVERTAERDYIPRFERLGISAREAWTACRGVTANA